MGWNELCCHRRRILIQSHLQCSSTKTRTRHSQLIRSPQIVCRLGWLLPSGLLRLALLACIAISVAYGFSGQSAKYYRLCTISRSFRLPSSSPHICTACQQSTRLTIAPALIRHIVAKRRRLWNCPHEHTNTHTQYMRFVYNMSVNSVLPTNIPRYAP